GLLRRVWASLWHPRVEHVPRWWLRCPICDRELVGPWHAGTHVARNPGLEWLDPTREELISKCPVHGRLPYNDASKKPPWPRAPLERDQ
ncbi:MAG: hypothetical protein JWL83_731, partial [Actinomycetia bacterium]|nr:hypothetical protein [Actinomycetes bacterium]